MDIATNLSAMEKSKVQMQVDSFNKKIAGERTYKSELDKDDFLKILLTQLTHQDPTKPMEDKEFIAQMAQFSSLEQMTNMTKEFGQMQNMVKANHAVSLIGKSVNIVDNGEMISGVVEEVSGYEYPQLLVNGKYYDLDKVEKIR